jgi:hypothetical protein
MFHAMRELRRLPDAAGRVFALQDLRGLLPAQGLEASKAIVARLEKRGELERV